MATINKFPTIFKGGYKGNAKLTKAALRLQEEALKKGKGIQLRKEAKLIR